jgi:hypothetical protein
MLAAACPMFAMTTMVTKILQRSKMTRSTNSRFVVRPAAVAISSLS